MQALARSHPNCIGAHADASLYADYRQTGLDEAKAEELAGSLAQAYEDAAGGEGTRNRLLYAVAYHHGYEHAAAGSTAESEVENWSATFAAAYVRAFDRAAVSEWAEPHAHEFARVYTVELVDEGMLERESEERADAYLVALRYALDVGYTGLLLDDFVRHCYSVYYEKRVGEGWANERALAHAGAHGNAEFAGKDHEGALEYSAAYEAAFTAARGQGSSAEHAHGVATAAAEQEVWLGNR